MKIFLAGNWVDKPKKLEVKNPFDNSVIDTVSRADAADLEKALAFAERGAKVMAKLSSYERWKILRKAADLMAARNEELGQTISKEEGKVITEGRGEASRAVETMMGSAEEAKRIYGDTIPSPWEDRRLVVIKEPIGVCAAITPWNFPAAMITRKLAPALAAGCTLIAKPAESTPFSALALAVLAERAGVPPGVFSVLTGNPREIGGEMTATDVRKLTFTGSTEVGRTLMRQSAETIKKLSLELGGNAPFIVFDDADLDAAVSGAIASKYRNAGQTCVCVNRLYVQAGVYDVFAAKLVEAVKALKVGNGLEPGVLQGPLINQAAVDKVEEHIRDAVSKGAEILTGGKRHARAGNGFYLGETADVSRDAKVAREETFGPLAPLFRFETDEEALRLANDTEFGLASYFYSRDVGRVWKVAEGLESGMVGINTGMISTEVAPFGGVKQSGLGREGSSHGIDEFVEVKYLCFGGLATPNP